RLVLARTTTQVLPSTKKRGGKGEGEKGDRTRLYLLIGAGGVAVLALLIALVVLLSGSSKPPGKQSAEGKPPRDGKPGGLKPAEEKEGKQPDEKPAQKPPAVRGDPGEPPPIKPLPGGAVPSVRQAAQLDLGEENHHMAVSPDGKTILHGLVSLRVTDAVTGA